MKILKNLTWKDKKSSSETNDGKFIIRKGILSLIFPTFKLYSNTIHIATFKTMEEAKQKAEKINEKHLVDKQQWEIQKKLEIEKDKQYNNPEFKANMKKLFLS